MIYETFREAIQNIWSNKFRTFLTMLGIIIGVTAVIVIVGLGNGMTQSIQSSFSDLGTNIISVQVMGYGSRSVKVEDVYAGEVAAPERIVMTRDGREKNSFDKGTETYEKIVSTLGQLIEAQLDENEQVKDLGRKLDGTKSGAELESGVWLIYEYAADSYAPVYFELTDTQNSVVGIYSPVEDSLTLHGFWSATEAQELLDYLNKQ